MSFQQKFIDKVLPIATKLAGNKYLLSLRDGFMVAFPATMFASIMIIIQNLPATFGFQKFLPAGVMQFLNDFLGPISNATMNITALFVAFGVAYQLADKLHASKLYAGGISLSSFMLLLPMTNTKAGTFIPVDKLGAQGMFVAIITAIVSTIIFARLENANITIKMPEQVPPAIAGSFVAILPGAASLMTFTVVRYLFTFTAWGNAFDFIYKMLQEPLQGLGASLPAVLLIMFISQLLWWFGIHGTLVVNSVVDPIMAALAIENYNAYRKGLPLPHIVNTTFMGVFVITGMILGLSLAALIFAAKSARMKRTMEMVALPAFFNISEPITFGLPIVLNPTIFIPWVLCPMIMAGVSYFAMSIGLVPRPTGATIVWSTPVFLSGWLGTGSIRGAILQLVNVAITTVIWLPFLKVLDHQYLTEEQATAATEAATAEAAPTVHEVTATVEEPSTPQATPGESAVTK